MKSTLSILLGVLVAIALYFFYGRSETPAVPEKRVQQVRNYTFVAPENIADDAIIGSIGPLATEGNQFTYSIKQDDSGLFEVDAKGGLSLINGKKLDYETQKEHRLIISVDDGVLVDEGHVLIKVVDVAESMAEDSGSFVLTWRTESEMENIIIGLYNSDYSYDFRIDWGDGSMESILPKEDFIEHTYEVPGTYKVAVQGEFPAFYFGNTDRLMSLDQWGRIKWQNLSEAFLECYNMEYRAVDVPDLTQVTDLSSMFEGASAFDANIGNWDISNISNMENMLSNSGMQPSTYGGTLQLWAKQDKIPTDLILGADALQIDCANPESVTARDYLINTKKWTISDTPCP
ncbi:BspA family leucine-rich repeat surface protein [Flagellimonas crocea]|uniref:BspA family leucine-rich repeat surface protein n=1 Tax=Flagellimonas crocea TaxID=3067311 RepID=UPI00296EAAF9|nr:BspA family leucine-rich repeat surface protein [Muricauda sp. DH64]